MTMSTPGGLMPATPEKSERQIWLLQRTAGRPGARLNKTSGWVHRATLKNKKVAMVGGVGYERIDDAGLHVVIDGKAEVLDVDNVIVCAGQEPNRELHEALIARGVDVRLVGGADVAAELDAKRAIDKATRLAAAL
jgi:2,4-dienoyl-CoA reductase (NADPH2)